MLLGLGSDSRQDRQPGTVTVWLILLLNIGICLMNLFVDQGQTISPWFPTRPTWPDHDRAKVSLSLFSVLRLPSQIFVLMRVRGPEILRVAAVGCDQDPGPCLGSVLTWSPSQIPASAAHSGTLSCFSTLKPWRHHLWSLSLSSVSKTLNIVNIDIYAWENHDTGQPSRWFKLSTYDARCKTRRPISFFFSLWRKCYGWQFVQTIFAVAWLLISVTLCQIRERYIGHK